MSMNQDSENFEALRKLLVLKRYEQPPPGYFNRLPGQIIAQIELYEEEEGFWQKIWSGFVIRPAHAYALGLTFCSAVVTGVIYSLQVQPSQVALQPVPTPLWEYSVPTATLASRQELPQLHVPGFVPSTNNENEALPSLFGSSFGARMTPVSYSFGSH